MNTAAAAVEVPYRTFMCVVCGFIYNEAEGWPADGIAPGTRWEDVSDTWTCPYCGVPNSDFEMAEIAWRRFRFKRYRPLVQARQVGAELDELRTDRVGIISLRHKR